MLHTITMTTAHLFVIFVSNQYFPRNVKGNVKS